MRVYTILADAPDYMGPGPAGDGTHVYRFRERRNAELFAKGATCYGNPIKVGDPEDVPDRIAKRWTFYD